MVIKTGFKLFLSMGTLLLLIVIMFFISMNTGIIHLEPLEVLTTFIGNGTDKQNLILFEFRLPRIIIALLIGSGLAVSGAILQGISRNGLADPGILGINVGAGLAVVLFIYFTGGTAGISSSYTIFIMPFFAFIGASFAAFLIYILAWKEGVTPARLLLVGIAVAAGFGAILIIFQLKMDPRDFMQATIWLAGSIWGTDWKFVIAVLPWIILLIPFAIYKGRVLDVLNLGDSTAIGLGAFVERERRVLIFISVALAGSSVAVGGGIAFLGLVAPHIARRLVGPKHQLLPWLDRFYYWLQTLLEDQF